MGDDALPFALRAGTLDDVPFVIDSWALSYSGQARARDAGPLYLRGQKRMIRAVLARRTASLLVACVADEPTTIAGWAVTEGEIVHYAFTKKDFRRLGIARSLLEPYTRMPRVYFTHKTWVPCVPAGWIYDPYAAAFPDLATEQR